MSEFWGKRIGIVSDDYLVKRFREVQKYKA